MRFVTVTSPSADTATAVQWLVDRAQISDLVNRYASCVDRKDWDGWSALLTDDAEIVLAGGLGAGPRGRAAVTEWASHNLADVDGTQHIITSHEIDLRGDEADVHTRLVTTHAVGQGDEQVRLTAGGFYDYHVRRTEDSWRIDRAQVQIVWTDGDPQGRAAAADVRRPA